MVASNSFRHGANENLSRIMALSVMAHAAGLYSFKKTNARGI